MNSRVVVIGAGSLECTLVAWLVEAGVDIVCVTTKAQDRADAARWLRSLVGPTTVVVLVQNGIDHARRLGARPPGPDPPVARLPLLGARRPGRGAPPGDTAYLTPPALRPPQGWF